MISLNFRSLTTMPRPVRRDVAAAAERRLKNERLMTASIDGLNTQIEACTTNLANVDLRSDSVSQSTVETLAINKFGLEKVKQK